MRSRSPSPQPSSTSNAASRMDSARLSEPSGSHFTISADETDMPLLAALDVNPGSAILPIDVDLGNEIDETPQPTSDAAGLLEHLRAATLQLPTSVSIGTFSDSLSRFSGNLEADFALGEYQHMWEMVDTELDRVIGFEKSIAEIAYLIRRGRLGMDGMCNWLSQCLSRADISAEVLERKMDRLLEAITTL